MKAKEIPTSVRVDKLNADQQPKFRFSWQEPGPDYGKPVQKGCRRPRRIVRRSKTRSFISEQSAFELQKLMSRSLERARDQAAIGANANETPEQTELQVMKQFHGH